MNILKALHLNSKLFLPPRCVDQNPRSKITIAPTLILLLSYRVVHSITPRYQSQSSLFQHPTIFPRRDFNLHRQLSSSNPVTPLPLPPSPCNRFTTPNSTRRPNLLRARLVMIPRSLSVLVLTRLSSSASGQEITGEFAFCLLSRARARSLMLMRSRSRPITR